MPESTTYTDDQGFVYYNPPRRVVVAGVERGPREWCYPGITATYEFHDRVTRQIQERRQALVTLHEQRMAEEAAGG